MELLYALASVVFVSLLSLVGVVTLLFKEKTLKKTQLILIAFAAGTLLGSAFFDLIPETLEHEGTGMLLYVLSGIILFLMVESFVHWHHCYREECDVHPKKSIGVMNLIGDGVHNFIDGVVIAAAYLVSVPVGMSATMAIAFHEIPQELGDFAVLMHSGFKKKKAVLYNLASALTAVVGAVAGYYFLSAFTAYLPIAIAVGAGGFIYIALADLFPEINKHREFKRLVIQTLSVIIGIALIFYMINALPHTHAETHEHAEVSVDNHTGEQQGGVYTTAPSKVVLNGSSLL